jgi:hypothetical protein
MNLSNVKKIVLAFVVVISISSVAAQANKEDSTKKRMRITAFNIDFGFSASNPVLTVNDYFKMKNTAVDQSQFISNPEDYSLNSYSGSGGSFVPSISLGFTPYSKKRGEHNYNREFRIKLGGSFGSGRSFFFSQNETFPYDTLTSAIGNPDIYIDSVYFHNISYVENISEINIGMSYLFKTNAKKRWYLYAGVGAEYGFAFQDYVTIDDDEGYYGTRTNNNNNNFNNNNYSYNSTKTKLTSNTHFVRMYIPLGINFRIANNNNFFKHVNIYSQFSPGIEFQIVTSVETYTNPYIGIAVIGFRYTFD